MQKCLLPMVLLLTLLAVSLSAQPQTVTSQDAPPRYTPASPQSRQTHPVKVAQAAQNPPAGRQGAGPSSESEIDRIVREGREDRKLNLLDKALALYNSKAEYKKDPRVYTGILSVYAAKGDFATAERMLAQFPTSN